MPAHQRKSEQETKYHKQKRKSASPRYDRTGTGNRSMAGLGWAVFDDMCIRYSAGQSEQVTQPTVHSSFLPESYRKAATITGISAKVKKCFRSIWGERWKDYVSPSDILRASLIIDGQVPDSNHWGSDENGRYTIENQAHHIVEQSNAHGNDILRMAGIDPNSAANGVFLPVHDGDATGDATLHNGSHVGEYQICINRALDKAVKNVQPSEEYRKAVLPTLQRIRTVLLTCNVPINGRVDATYSDKNRGPETIKQIFHRAGLF